MKTSIIKPSLTYFSLDGNLYSHTPLVFSCLTKKEKFSNTQKKVDSYFAAKPFLRNFP